MSFSVITPSFNMKSYLELCHLSIIDQDVDFEHIVIDNESSDGTKSWLKNNKDIRFRIGKDSGMYDAINKGIKLSNNEFISYLNCDEQYLPGTLKKIEIFFKNNPNVDIVYGDKINIFPDGSFNSYKKSLRINKYYILASNLYIPSCSLFFRKDILKKNLFNIKYKTCGDTELIIKNIDLGKNFFYYKDYLATFTIRKNNLSQTKLAEIDRTKLLKENSSIPLFILRFLLFNKMIEKLLNKSFNQKFPLIYEIFTVKNLKQRTYFKIEEGSFRTNWK
tara:strand:- start:14 stop:844 length:831 start_codon:yes stop_codon:yes gene_type:complete